MKVIWESPTRRYAAALYQDLLGDWVLVTARGVLLRVLQEHQPAVVLTTSWLRFMQKQGFEAVFKRTGLELVSSGFREA